MTQDELIQKLTETEQRSKSNTHRIDELEQDQKALNKLATSVAVMAQEQQTIRRDVAKSGEDIKAVRKDDKLILTITTNEDITLERGLFGSRAEFFREVYSIEPVIRQKRIL